MPAPAVLFPVNPNKLEIRFFEGIYPQAEVFGHLNLIYGIHRLKKPKKKRTAIKVDLGKVSLNHARISRPVTTLRRTTPKFL